VVEGLYLEDWRSIMAAFRLWLQGGNPYGPYTGFLGELQPAGWFAYPPSSLPIGGLVALLPWQLSGLLFVIANIVCFELWSRRTSGRSGVLWMLLWLPLAHGLIIGQTSLLIVFAVLAAEALYAQRRDRAAGLLLALALLKPQIVLLPVAWLLLRAARERRLSVPLMCVGLTAALWAGAMIISGPEIVADWGASLGTYSGKMFNRPLIFLPLGPVVALAGGLLWWRHGRTDWLGALLLLNTLVYPLSVAYMCVALAVVVVRWRRGWAAYPLALSWLLPIVMAAPERSELAVALLLQSISLTGLLAGLLPQLPLRLWRRAATPAR
jgi:hypothetical protein